MRLNKYLAQAGFSSRRQADEAISEGRVRVNKEVVTKLGSQIDPEKDLVTVDGKKMKLVSDRVIYLLNKPCGVVTTASDNLGRKTVLDLVPATPRVFPCGRLDEDTVGLVVLTNDGNLCYQLTHPKFEHQKEYHVVGQSNDPQASWEKIQKGVTLKDGSVKADKLELRKIHRRKIDFLITIHEGRNRLIRRLCAAVGIEVHQLARTKLGKYELGDLEPGKWKVVS